MSVDSSALLSAIKWSDSSDPLKEFAKKYEFPQIGKIVRGQHLTIGVPSLSSPSLNQIVLWGLGGKRVKVIAQSVRFKEGRNANNGPNGRAVPTGPKLAIPDNYDGWWEILSEEGKSVRCIESAVDLSKRVGEMCLIRDNVKVYIAKTDDPNMMSEKVRILQTGELITIQGIDVIVSNTKSNGVRYLRCLSSKGDIIFLNVDQKGKFSPVAKEGISGVHSMANLLTKRLPLMARLVYGKPPHGLKNFHSNVRLYSSYEEECLIALPLVKDTQCLIQVPINCSLKILGPKNADQLCEMTEFSALKELSQNLMQGLTDRMHVLDIQHLSKDLKASLKENSGNKGRFAFRLQGHQHDHKTRLQSNFLVKRSLSDPQQINATADKMECTEQLRRGTSLDDSHTDLKTCKQLGVSEECNEFYDEIDQIYDYVRGFAPLPDRIRCEFHTTKASDAAIDAKGNENKPEPPPVITIPSIQQKQRHSYPIVSQKVNKVSDNVKKVRKYFPNKENIFGKSSKKEEKMIYFPNVRIHYNNNCGNNGIYLPTTQLPQPNHLSSNGPKLFVKNSSGQRNTWKANRFLKYAKHVSSPFRNEAINENEVKQQNSVSTKGLVSGGETCRSSRSLTTSPIFNIRYKSMNNLHYVTPPTLDYNNTLDSSNSGHTSSGSGSRDLFRDPKSKFPKLSRSLTNVFWDMSGNFVAIDTIDKLNNELNERKNKNSFQLLPVHIDFLNALDRLHTQNDREIKEQNIKTKQMATLYL